MKQASRVSPLLVVEWSAGAAARHLKCSESADRLALGQTGQASDTNSPALIDSITPWTLAGYVVLIKGSYVNPRYSSNFVIVTFSYRSVTPAVTFHLLFFYLFYS